MARDQALKLGGALLLFAFAAWMAWRYFAAAGGPTEQAFFYDLSERKLFVGPRTAVPPIRGLNGPEEDAVRAVVISTNGRAADKSARRIAYLEKYSAELKREMEAAQKAGGSPAMGRGLAQAHRFVRRADGSEWHPLTSPEAERIVSEWLTLGPGGGPAVICTP